MLYGIECWLIIHKMSIAKTKMLKQISKNTGRWNSKQGNPFKDRGSPYWCKNEEELFEIIWSCSEESK